MCTFLVACCTLNIYKVTFWIPEYVFREPRLPGAGVTSSQVSCAGSFVPAVLRTGHGPGIPFHRPPSLFPQTCHSSSTVDWAAPIFKPLLQEGFLHLKRALCLRVFFQNLLCWLRAWPGPPQPPTDRHPPLLLWGPKIYSRVVAGDPKPCSRPKW